MESETNERETESTVTVGNSEGFSSRTEGNPKFWDVVTEKVYISQQKSGI